MTRDERVGSGWSLPRETKAKPGGLGLRFAVAAGGWDWLDWLDWLERAGRHACRPGASAGGEEGSP